MKKNLFTLGLMAFASLILATNCTKSEKDILTNDDQEEITPVNSTGVPFEIVVNPTVTKTTNSTLSTAWSANDDITLFHREYNTTGSYSSNDHFTITSENLDSKKFSGTLSEALSDGHSYDWWAIYPFSSYYTTPENTSVYTDIGMQVRTVTGYGTTSHLAGPTMPLIGKVSNVTSDTKPAITLNQVASVAKVVVTNNSGADLVITSVRLTAPENIVGQFKVNFSDPDNPTFVDGPECYDTATLSVKSGTTIANGGTATFYIPVKPFSLAVNDELTIKVNTCSKTVAMTSAMSFEPGVMKTINFNYNKVFASQNFYLASSISDGDKIIFASGTDGATKAMGRYTSGANNIAAVDGTVTDGCLPSTAAMGIYTVGGNSTTGYTFYDEESDLYLSSTETKANYLKGVNPNDAWGLWDVTITANVVEALCKGTDKTSYHIRKNSSGAIFSCYTSAQAPVYIFKLDERTPVTLAFTETSLEYLAANVGDLSIPSLNATPNVSSVTGNIVYSIEDTNSITTGFNTSDGSYTLNGTAGTATITATFNGDASYRPATASYTVKVTAGVVYYYRKITSSTSLSNGDYLIVYESGNFAFDGSLDTFDAVGNTIAVEISDGKIVANATTDASKFTITSVSGGYTVRGASGDYIGVSSWANGLTTEADPFTVSIDFSNNNVVITKTFTDGTVTLKYNNASNQRRFRFYKTGQQAIQLYKRD